MKKFRLLSESEIECKIKKVTASGVVLLLYKTARTDMDLLDETVGPENWTCDYREVKGNLYCRIGINCKRAVEDANGLLTGYLNEWVYKEDCGIESREDDGNEKKGEASDAFKRAGFRWGIGRELYTAPFTFIPASKCNIEGNRCFDTFSVERIAYDENGRIKALAIWNDKTGRRAFVWQREE
jgi:hypothetical protein